MEAIFSILLLVAIGALIIGGLMLLRKARRKTGLITVGVAFVALAVSVGQVNSITEQETLAKDQEAHALGFLDHDDQVLASTFGYASSSAEQWVEVREEKIQERADEQRRAQLRAQAEARQAAEAAAAAEAEEQLSGLHCLSDWDGSHRELARAVIDNLNDPGSFEHVETRITKLRDSGTHGIIMTFRANNAFGALVLGNVTASVNGSDCGLLEWTLVQ